MQNRRAYLAVVLLAGVFASYAGAQTQQPIFDAPQPPRIDLPDTNNSWQGIVAGVLVGGLVLVASMIPSKRGHQD